jgi:serine/threonine protein kinase
VDENKDAPGRDLPSYPGLVGPFRIVRVVGRGVRGTVYEAMLPAGTRTFALKLLDRDRSVGDRKWRLFWREADAARRLDHPSIAALHSVGFSQDGRLYCASEMVMGEPLNRFIDRHPICSSTGARDLRALLELFRRICGAVEHAHQRGVIHGDLRPANILVGPVPGATCLEEAARSASVKVVDFSLARISENPLVRAARRDDPIESLAYLAPEQASGSYMDVRGDVYALGLILYRLLTGAEPFQPAASRFALLRSIRDVEPRPPGQIWRTRGRRMGSDLERIVLEAIAKDPDRRYQNVWALDEDVRRYLHRQPILARPPTAAYRMRKFLSRNPGAVSMALWACLVLVGALLS